MRNSLTPLAALTGLLLTTTTAAATTALSQTDCVVAHSADLAALSDCPDHDLLRDCLAQLADADSEDELETCYLSAGCSYDQAAVEALHALDRCGELSNDDGAQDIVGDLRRRQRLAAAPPSAQVTPAPAFHGVDAAATAAAALFKRTDADKGTGSDECMVFVTTSITSCPLTTSDGHVRTASCFPTVATKSHCADGMKCTHDASGQDICMRMQNSLDLGGIIVAIVMAVAALAGLGTLAFLCVKDRREQKRLTAKAEASALIRSQTRKDRNREVRETLLPAGRSRAAADPFADQQSARP